MTVAKTFDIQASAGEVIALLRSGDAVKAKERWEALRAEADSPVVQEALDRMIAVEGKQEIQSLRTSSDFSAKDRMALKPMFDQVDSAKNAPRMPDASETADLTDAQKYDIYSTVLRLRGAEAVTTALNNNDRVILGMRQETSSLEDRGRGEYDDKIVVVWRDKDGTRHASEFNQATTEPTAQYDRHHKENSEVISKAKVEGIDVDGDGVEDAGRLRSDITVELIETTHAKPGAKDKDGKQVYEFSLRPSQNAISVGANMVERDTNGDGKFDEKDQNLLQWLNDTFKIHRGSNNNTDSAGCQTIRGADYDTFISSVKNSGQTRWQYALTSTNPTLEIDHSRMPDSDVSEAILVKANELKGLNEQLANTTDVGAREVVQNKIDTVRGEIANLETTRQELLTLERESLDREKKELTEKVAVLEGAPEQSTETIKEIAGYKARIDEIARDELALDSRIQDPLTRVLAETNQEIDKVKGKIEENQTKRNNLTDLNTQVDNYKGTEREDGTTVSLYDTVQGSLKENGVYVPLTPEQLGQVSAKGLSGKDETEQAQQFLFDRGHYGDKKREDVVTGKWDQKVDGPALDQFQRSYRAEQIKGGVPEKDAMSIDIDKGIKPSVGRQFRAAMNHDEYLQNATPEQIKNAIEAKNQALLQEHGILIGDKTILGVKADDLQAMQNAVAIDPLSKLKEMAGSIDPIKVATVAMEIAISPGYMLLKQLADNIGNPEKQAEITQEIKNSDVGAKLETAKVATVQPASPESESPTPQPDASKPQGISFGR